ncbi:hypothetical protein PTSG_09240 [Salpingoeca rosetta]|uniref:Phosphoribulokinase/uridine kinase domain-containing protein n=1 Tax=Salpingoeca rosetta (strain ATCC 50818 / BSB-021) TaxID=946362 RepID=F2UN49_SALR5|nr:uncharacterized protein PTSG_09240 [Salpingoeca rosetta]EGD78548.1 hypothetical protein PTSG_09240 [Salpingoeca rosetta]|eukprot:XP_004989497.1 hypothetical protein PTSG_09240 [Salpingoeca rosetta]
MYSSWNKRPQRKPVDVSRPLILGVVGGSCSGKTRFCKDIQDYLENKYSVAILSQNQFYRPEIAHEHTDHTLPNYDHPDAFDYERMGTVLRALKAGESIQIRKSDVAPVRPEPSEESVTIPGNVDVVIVKGILTWFKEEDLFDIKVFISLDPDLRLSERVLRDRNQGRRLDDILDYYFACAKLAYEKYTEPLSASANMIIPRGSENRVGVEIVASYIAESLQTQEERARNGAVEDKKTKAATPATTPSPSSSSATTAAPAIIDAKA